MTSELPIEDIPSPGLAPRSRRDVLISVVAPAYNEEANLEQLCQVVSRVLDAEGCRFEIVLAENGSVDRSLTILRDLHARDPRINYVSLSRNFGSQGGLLAGLSHARGEVIITMDADLQHPPDRIPDLLDKWEAGFDVVTSRRRTHESVGWVRSVLNKAFYEFMYRATGIPLGSRQSDFRLMSRNALNALLDLPEKHKFLRCLTYWIGFRQSFIEYDVAPRAAGESKYRVGDLLRFALDGITSFTILPLRLFTYLGLAVSLGALLYGIVILLDWLLGSGSQMPEGYASLAIGVFFLGGIQLIGIGMLGEYLGRVYDETRGRPTFIVQETTLAARPTGQSEHPLGTETRP